MVDGVATGAVKVIGNVTVGFVEGSIVRRSCPLIPLLPEAV